MSTRTATKAKGKASSAKPAAAKEDAAPEVATPAAVPPAAVAPAAVAPAVVPAADSDEDADSTEKKNRQQIAEVLDIEISHARVHNLLRDHVQAPDGTAMRIAAKTPIAISVAMDFLVKELLRHSITQAAGVSKIVHVAHVHSGTENALVCYPILTKLAGYTGYTEEKEAALMAALADQNKKLRKAKEDAKAGRPAEAVEKPGRNRFATYVNKAREKVKKTLDADVTVSRISTRLPEYLAQLVEEAVLFLAERAQPFVLSGKVKTMNVDHILYAIKMVMAEEHRDEQQYAELVNLINAKLAVYDQYVDECKKHKFEQMDDQKKQTLSDKQVKDEYAKLSLQLEKAETKEHVVRERITALRTQIVQLTPKYLEVTAKPAAA